MRAATSQAAELLRRHRRFSSPALNFIQLCFLVTILPIFADILCIFALIAVTDSHGALQQ